MAHLISTQADTHMSVCALKVAQAIIMDTQVLSVQSPVKPAQVNASTKQEIEQACIWLQQSDNGVDQRELATTSSIQKLSQSFGYHGDCFFRLDALIVICFLQTYATQASSTRWSMPCANKRAI